MKLILLKNKSNLAQVNIIIISIFVLIFYFVLCYQQNADYIEYGMAVLLGVLRYQFLISNFNIERPGRIVLWIFLEFNFPVYVYLQGMFWPEKNINPALNMLAVSFILLFIFFVLSLLLSRIKVQPSSEIYTYKVRFQKIMPYLFPVFLVVCFSTAFTGYYLGIGKMGNVEPELPFKLPKIINTLRNLVFPFLFIIAIDYYYEGKNESSKNKRMFYAALSMLILYTVLESFLRGTRGLVLLIGISLFFWRTTKGKVSLKITAILLITFFPVLLFGYSIFSSIRLINIQGMEISYENIENNFSLSNPFSNFETYHRLFGNGYEVNKFSGHMQNNWVGIPWSDFTSLEGAGIGYHTQIIDGIKINQGHSSGINGLSDGFLSFGYPGLFAMIIIFSFAFWGVDFQQFRLVSLSSVGRSQLYYLLTAMLFTGSGSISFLFRNPLYHLVLVSLFTLQALVIKRGIND